VRLILTSLFIYCMVSVSRMVALRVQKLLGVPYTACSNTAFQLISMQSLLVLIMAAVGNFLFKNNRGCVIIDRLTWYLGRLCGWCWL